ncbi:MAG: hypothetical protein HC800_13380 [Phormidesmis sp. RL_2_1]|nr:hypothetical protein [Phormidesmis sp. RL_2_1]
MVKTQIGAHASPAQHPPRPRLGRALLLSSTLVTGFIGAGLASVLSSAAPSFAQTSEPLPEVEPSTTEPSTPGETPLPGDTRFECQLYEGAFTVVYRPESQPERVYPWATPRQMGGGWTAERRCFAISDRLESYRPEGLVELQTGTENGYNIVCATTEQSPGLCKIVFTVPPGQDPVATRDLVFENLALADAGNDTTIVNTFTGNGNNDLLGQIGEAINFPLGRSSSARSSSGINLKPFLDSADGGTGTALNAPATPSRPLNPDNFR